MHIISEQTHYSGNEIAVIGMAGRFPKAPTLEAFWHNIYNGVEAITFFTAEELLDAGVPASTLENPDYVRANVLLEGIDLFDAAFFGYSPREAALLDPQQRLFLQCAWHALEHAGYNPHTYTGPIGVYASQSSSTYLLYNLVRNRHLLETMSMLQLLYGTEKDFLATRVSYKLGLRGPSVTVQAACASSLVAVHLACQSLLNGECDIALAGGVCVNTQTRRGYLYQSDGYFSRDGHCRSFDARSEGTLGGSGLGIITLKRLDDALNDGDTIHALIRGTAINNDGDAKIGYSAPSVQGQASVIAEALTVAAVEPETVSYIETHGTGTPIGDPIEITALRRAFEKHTTKKGFCAIGSIKTNMGHLDAAAGIAGLLKTTLALKHRCLPPHLHFETPNPLIDFASSPFYVNTIARAWPEAAYPRRAGVSSFGIGGTNTHIILEEAPPTSSEATPDGWQILPLSARTPLALGIQQQNLVTHLKQSWESSLADSAYTLQEGRYPFSHRSFVVCRNVEDAINTLEGTAFTGQAEEHSTPIVFMFPGGGSQYINMGRELYEQVAIFREEVDRCTRLLQPHLDYDLLALLYPSQEQEKTHSHRFERGFISLPVLFVTEYALAKTLIRWGISPKAMIGHSLGEYVAACLAGVFALEDVLAFVALREKLSADLAPGAMLSILLPEHELDPFLNEQVSLGAVNNPSQCVVSGSIVAIEQLEHTLQEHAITYRRLHISVAGHSAQLEPILNTLTTFLQTLQLHSPSIPFVSNLTGTWITSEQATSYHYWINHLRHAVRFSAGIQTLLEEPGQVLLEVGPGQTLSLLAKNILVNRRHQQGEMGHDAHVLMTMRHAQEQSADLSYLLTTVGHLWLQGQPVAWSALHECKRRRVPLPIYPFEGKRYWIEPDIDPLASNSVMPTNGQKQDMIEQEVSHIKSAQTIYAAPENEIEQTIAVIWQEVLGIDQIRRNDNYFELGGDSLIGLKLIVRLKEAFSLELPLRTLFEHPTVTRLAEAIDLLFIEEIEHLSEEQVNALLVSELTSEPS
jgi:acyl transferase domain-containing protein